MSKKPMPSSDQVTTEIPVVTENLALIYKTALEIKLHEVGFLKRENSNFRSANAELRKKINMLDAEIKIARHELAEMQRSIAEVWKRSAEMSQGALLRNNMRRPLLLTVHQRVN